MRDGYSIIPNNCSQRNSQVKRRKKDMSSGKNMKKEENIHNRDITFRD